MLLIMILLNMFISFLLVCLNLFISKKDFMDREKLSPFECGFNPFSSARLPFSINFYMISILFLVFDVEVVFLFPMIDLIEILNYYEWFLISMFIIYLLYLGLEFEKKEGSLKWMF